MAPPSEGRKRSASTIASAPDAVVDAIASMIRTCMSDPTYELEARLGKYAHSKFVPGVSREHMDALVRSLEMLRADAAATGTVTSSHDTWEEEENYYFDAGKRRVRTRVTFEEVTTPVTIEKVVVESIVLKTHLIDVRISLSREIPVPNPPAIVNTSHMRIKQRRSFAMVGRPYVIECAMIWSGQTKVEAETSQSTSEPLFEVECEFSNAPPEQWAAKYGNDTRAMATSLLYKVADIMMSTGISFVPV